ncbi:caprin homolog [Euwallacea fornicatus]|uniref:caprin homolog n=1 Tax=Euwallacea fornicatus TaxID=995702 RepID=UPI00338DD684
MPSAANVKVDKQISPAENALVDNGNSATTPLRQAITIIEHKIRNLEKRKSKLESYRDLQNSGKELNTDQKTALAKINEVIMTLDFARDLYKQFLGIASSSEKDAKKQAKRESSLKNQAELARLREILLVQDALHQMGIDNVRDDFLNGKNGAAQLTETDLKLLDDLYPAVTPKHESGNPTAFTNEVQAAAEHLLAVVDGKQKDVFGGSYSQIKEILGKIHESGYFDQAQETLEENVEVAIESEVLIDQPDPAIIEVANEVAVVASVEALTIEASHLPPVHATPSIPPPVVQPVPPPVVAPVQAPLVLDATVPHQLPLQEMFYQPPPPQQQPPKPITEMLGSGSFFFLQDSEIDTPEQIPTQTFTNQTFVVQPPPPIPMPHALHFQAPQQISPGNLPPTVNHQVPPGAAPALQQPVSIPSNKGDVPLNKPPTEDLDKHSLNRAPQNRNPPAQNNHQPPAFYNNGYSNRSNRPPHHQSRNNGVQGRAQSNRH